MKKVLTFAIAGLMALTGCTSIKTDDPKDNGGSSDTSAVEESGMENGSAESSSSGTFELPNPWSEFLTLDEAVEYTGIEIIIPDEFNGREMIYRGIANELIEVIIPLAGYEGIESGIATFRAAPLTKEDISGDYNSYPVHMQTKTGGIFVDTYGNDNDVINLIKWSDEERSYTVTFDEGIPSSDAQSVYTSLLLSNSVQY